MKEILNFRLGSAKSLLLSLTRILSGDVTDFMDGDIPTDDIEPGEQIVGVIEDPVIRALWIFSQRIGKDLSADIAEFHKAAVAESKDEIVPIRRNLQVSRDICQAVSKLFWAHMLIAFPQTNTSHLQMTVKSGWRVTVRQKDDSEEILLAFLG